MNLRENVYTIRHGIYVVKNKVDLIRRNYRIIQSEIEKQCGEHAFGWVNHFRSIFWNRWSCKFHNLQSSARTRYLK